jgi:hypothetical protein
MSQTRPVPQTPLPFISGEDVLELIDMEEAAPEPKQARAKPDAEYGRPRIYDRRQSELTLIL